jgi:hypothetical protein
MDNLKLYLTGKKVTTQVEVDKYMLTELNLSFDNIKARIANDLIQRFAQEMVSNRINDMVEEEVRDGQATRFSMELFVFNRQDLQDLITLIQNK